jgi:peptidoglycan-associated lipoprotein
LEEKPLGGIPAGAAAPQTSDDLEALRSQRVVYFDYDSSEITAEARETIEAHVRYLVRHPDLPVLLEGHTDERGTREYNIALGERRAHSVRQIMELLGVSSPLLRTSTYGEEYPADPAHEESAWRLNRRVEIKYPP